MAQQHSHPFEVSIKDQFVSITYRGREISDSSIHGVSMTFLQLTTDQENTIQLTTNQKKTMQLITNWEKFIQLSTNQEEIVKLTIT